MYPGEGAYPGAAVEGFSEAWAAAIAGWKSHEGKAPGPEDRAHVETHVLLKCDAFITDDGPPTCDVPLAPRRERVRDRSDAP